MQVTVHIEQGQIFSVAGDILAVLADGEPMEDAEAVTEAVAHVLTGLQLADIYGLNVDQLLRSALHLNSIANAEQSLEVR